MITDKATNYERPTYKLAVYVFQLWGGAGQRR